MGYDDSGNLSSVTDPQGRVSSLTYTGMNRLQTFTDDEGRVWATTWDKAGNLLSVRDPKNDTWSMEYDDAGQLVRVNQPDTQKVDRAYDTLGRLVALVTPNGTQPDGSVNTLGLANLLTNPSAEEADPFDGNSAHARFWDYPALARSTAQHFEGDYSLEQFGGGRAPHQAGPSLPGVPLLARARFYIADPGWTYEAILGFASYAFDGSAQYSEQVVLPRNSGYPAGWRQVGPARFTASTLAQKDEHQLKLASYASSGFFEHAYWDNAELLPLGTSYAHDPAGRLGRVTRPDGSVYRIEHDRFGNVSRVVDALGRTVRFRYDGLNRLVEVLTPLGNSFLLAYDAVGNLSSFQEPGSPRPTTSYSYDDLQRLQSIQYPDSSTETFAYHDNSDLKTYTDNKGQAFEFVYDTADRLWKIDYVGLSQHVEFTYGAAGYLATRKERNGDLTTLTRDDLYQVLQEVFAPGVSSLTRGWTQVNAWDAVGNRRSLASGGATDRYGVMTYGSGHYGGPLWSVQDEPGSPGYDSMNRLKRFRDMDGLTTSMDYDVEGRRTRITHPNGAVTEAVHDAMGRVLSLTTVRSASTLLTLRYGYDPNSNRTSQVAGDRTFEYRLDDEDRLVGESINCWSIRSARELRAGTLSGTDTVTDPDKLVLLGWDDSFAGTVLNLDRWRPAFSQTDLPGFRVRQQVGLYLRFPEGYTDRVFGTEPPIVTNYGLSQPGAAVWGGVEHRRLLSGDFTVEADFDGLQQATAAVASPEPVPAGIVRVGVMVNSLAVERRTGPLAALYRTVDPAGLGDVWESQIQPGSPPATVASAAASGTSGSLRVQRSSGQLSTWYRPAGGSWTQVGATTSFSGDGLRVALLLETTYAPGSVRFTAFRETARGQ